MVLVLSLTFVCLTVYFITYQSSGIMYQVSKRLYAAIGVPTMILNSHGPLAV
jgi:hypothetical protein